MPRPELSPWNPLEVTRTVEISDSLLAVLHGAVHNRVEYLEKRWDDVRDLPPDIVEPEPEKPIDPSLPEPVKELLESQNEWIRKQNTFPDIGTDRTARQQDAIRNLLELAQWALEAMAIMRHFDTAPVPPSLELNGWKTVTPKRPRRGRF